eukprot:gene10855-14572_t
MSLLIGKHSDPRNSFSTPLKKTGQSKKIWVIHDFAGLYIIFLLGLASCLGGHTIEWTSYLTNGYASFIISLVIISLLQISHTLCLSELISGLPFSGGMYGFVRVAIGPQAGFMIGCCDIIQYILFACLSIYSFGMMITCSFSLFSSSYEPLLWLVVIIPAITIFMIGGRSVWLSLIIIVNMSVFFVAAYCFSSVTTFTNHELTSLENNNQYLVSWNSSYNFFQLLPYANWFFMGLTSLPLS